MQVLLIHTQMKIVYHLKNFGSIYPILTKVIKIEFPGILHSMGDHDHHHRHHMIVSYLATKPQLSVVIVRSRGNVGGNAEGNVGDELKAVHTLHL